MCVARWWLKTIRKSSRQFIVKVDLSPTGSQVLSEVCESRNNHRYAVVVQDLATQWIQLYPSKTITLLRKHKGLCKSSWSPVLAVHVPQVVKRTIGVTKMAEQILDVLVLETVEQSVKLPKTVSDDGIQRGPRSTSLTFQFRRM